MLHLLTHYVRQTLSIWALLEKENRLTVRLVRFSGLKKCNFWVPAIVTAIKWHISRVSCSTSYSSLVAKLDLMFLMFSTQNWKKSVRVKIWFLFALCKLALVANRFTVPPSPSHGPLPWLVVKKCHSAGRPKSFSRWHKFKKFLQFLYWPVQEVHIYIE